MRGRQRCAGWAGWPGPGAVRGRAGIAEEALLGQQPAAKQTGLGRARGLATAAKCRWLPAWCFLAAGRSTAEECRQLVLADADAPAAVGDGNDALRQRLREYTPPTVEDRRRLVGQKLGQVRQALRQDEVRALKRFEECENDGEHRAPAPALTHSSHATAAAAAAAPA